MSPYVAMLPDEVLTSAERYGFGGLFLGGAWFFYTMWKKSSDKLESERKERLAEAKAAIATLEQEKRDLVNELKEAQRK